MTLGDKQRLFDERGERLADYRDCIAALKLENKNYVIDALYKIADKYDVPNSLFPYIAPALRLEAEILERTK